jgi:alkaline phosphatase
MNTRLISTASLTLALSLLTGCNATNGTNGIPGITGINGKNGKDTLAVNKWYVSGQAKVAQAAALNIDKARGKAKNVILFIGDGMGVSTITAARIYAGQKKGLNGEEYKLSFENLPFTGLEKTYNTNQQTPDSAGTMTAMMTGVKAKAGVINIESSVARADCAGSLTKKLVTALQLSEMAGLSTGVVSTARITHATPAATYAASPERNWEYDAELPAAAKTAGCKDIASQLVDFKYGNGIEVALGGGRRNFIPKTLNDPEYTSSTGRRTDGRNLTSEWTTKYSNSAYVWNESQFKAIDATKTDHLLGLFEPSHMQYELDRSSDTGGEPSLAEMTGKSIEILKKNTKGYFLMVEAGRIDHAHHAGNAIRALEDTRALSDAVVEAMQRTDPKDTLILVTADHSHVFTIAGYPTRGNPILGKVRNNDALGNPAATLSTDANGLTYTTLGYTNGRGFAVNSQGDARYGSPIDTGRKDLLGVDTEDKGYHQEALIPLSAETHAGEDVAVYASGPAASLVQGTSEQNSLFHVIDYSMDLVNKAQKAMP